MVLLHSHRIPRHTKVNNNGTYAVIHMRLKMHTCAHVYVCKGSKCDDLGTRVMDTYRLRPAQHRCIMMVKKKKF